MPSFSQAIAVADITNLKALAASNGDIRKVTQLDATYAYPDSYYIFRLGVSYTERLPGIVEDDAANGFWVMFPQPLALSSGDPTGSADLPGILWVNTTTGDRFISNPDLSWSAVAGGGGATSTTTTTSYTQPAVDSNVTINVGDSSIFAVGQYVFVETGGNYKVISKPGATQLEIQNTGDTGNAVPSTSISSGSLVVPSGAFGDGTLSGTGATNRVGVWTTTDNIAGDDDLTFDSSTDTLAIAASGKLNFGAVPILDDSAGTTTLKNIDALDTTTRDVIRAAIDDGLTVAYHDTVSLTAEVGKLYLLDTTTTAVNGTLPAAPANGSVIAFADYVQNFATNNAIITRGGTDTIGDGAATSETLDVNGRAIKLVYWDGNWAIAQDSSSGGGGGATNLGYTASPTDGTVTSDTGTNATLTLADGTNAGLMAPADFTKLSGVETNADVTDTTNVTAAGALMDSEVNSLSGIKTLTVPDNTTISTFGATLTDDADAATARTTLGLGSAATLDAGTSANNVVQLDGSAALPAVDGSALLNLPSGFADPMTTRGDLIYRDATNVTTRLPIGTNGQVLTSDGTDVSWVTPSSGATNLGYTASPTNGTVTSDTGTDATLSLADVTNAGLLAPADFTKLGYLTATGAVNLDNLGTAAFLDVGTSASQVVQLDGSARLPAVDGSQLTNLPAGFADPMTTAGDIIIRNGSNSTTRLGIGSEGQVLKVSSGVPAWAAESGGGLSNPVAYITQSVQTVTLNGVGGTTSQMDNGTHNVFSLTVNANTTIAHSNVPSTGTRYGFELHLTWSSGTITWPTSWTKGDDATALTAGNYTITGVTIDGGTSWKIAILTE